MASHLYDFTLRTTHGEELPLEAFRGRPLLIVNTASKCGFTPQFEGLQEIYTRYRDRGLEVIGVPSGDFGGQELDDDAAIGAFCHRNYGVSFTIAEKSRVRDPGAIPLFAWLSRQGGVLARPRWNFYKYLIDRNGQLEAWYSSLTRPTSRRMDQAMLRLVWE